MTTTTKSFCIISLLAASTTSLHAYSGFNDCQRYTGLSNEQQQTYKQSSICVPIANVSGEDLVVTLYKDKAHGDKQVIGEGNVGEFTHLNQVPRGTSYNIVVQTKNNKIIYDSLNGSDAKAVNLVGLICMKSLTAKQAAKTIQVVPKPVKFGPVKCVPWTAIKPKTGTGPD